MKIKEDIPVTDDDLLFLDDDDEETGEYDWYNEPLAEDFGNVDIDWTARNYIQMKGKENHVKDDE